MRKPVCGIIANYGSPIAFDFHFKLYNEINDLTALRVELNAVTNTGIKL